MCWLARKLRPSNGYTQIHAMQKRTETRETLAPVAPNEIMKTKTTTARMAGAHHRTQDQKKHCKLRLMAKVLCFDGRMSAANGLQYYTHRNRFHFAINGRLRFISVFPSKRGAGFISAHQTTEVIVSIRQSGTLFKLYLFHFHLMNERSKL